MKTQILTKAILVFIISIFAICYGQGQNRIINSIDFRSSSEQKEIIKDTFPAIEKDKRSTKYKTSNPINNQISVDLINGKTRYGYLKGINSDSIYISGNFGDYNFNINEIKSINTRPDKDRSVEGALLGALIGSLPGIFMMHKASKNKYELFGAFETLGGLVVGVGGAIGGAISGAQIGRGITVTYKINGSKEKYNKEKAKIINDAFKI